MNKEYSYDYEWDAKYCYPKSNVLINKLGIIDATQLTLAERELTAFKIAKSIDCPIKGKFDLNHLQKIHKFIFEDIFDWAGELRQVDISKGNQFCLCNNLIMYANEIFSKLQKDNYLIDCGQVIYEKLSYYLSEINVLHPFREGNGRTQRMFIGYVANVAGYDVDFTNVSDRQMIVASANAFALNYDDLINVFIENTTKITKQEQIQAIQYFFGDSCPQYEQIARSNETLER
jgi:cell filamentation protein